MTYRPYFPLRGIIGGALLGLSIVVLLQQFAVVFPSRSVVLIAVLGGIVLDLLLANLLRASAVRRAPAAASVAAPVVPAAAADTGFRPTHRAPAGGLDAFDAPGAAAPTARLDPGLDVLVLEQQGDWAHVRCSNGWETWVDARMLVPR